MMTLISLVIDHGEGRREGWAVALSRTCLTMAARFLLLYINMQQRLYTGTCVCRLASIFELLFLATGGRASRQARKGSRMGR